MICVANTLADLIRLYSLYHPCLDPKSIAQYGYAVKSLERFKGEDILIQDLREDILLLWLSRRLKEVSPKTVKRERGDLLTLWRFGCKRGLITNPPLDIPVVKITKRNPNSWTVVEYQRLLLACRNMTGEMRSTGINKALWWESLVVFLYWTGCRIGAALAIRPADMDLKRRTVRLSAEASKTDMEQTLNLHPQALTAMSKILNPINCQIWPYPYGRRWIWAQYKRLLNKAGLPNDRTCMFQKTRRTTYTLCVKYGSKDIASRQLGHKTDMSQFYLDVSQLENIQAANVLPVI